MNLALEDKLGFLYFSLCCPGTRCPCASPSLPLLSLYYLSITLLTSWPFLPPLSSKFFFACSTITRSLTEEVHAALWDVIDGAGGLAGVIVPLLTSLAACLPPSLGPDENRRGVAC